MILILIAFNFLSAKTLVEAVDPIDSPDLAKQIVETNNIEVMTKPVVVQIAGGFKIPDFFNEPKFGMSLQKLISEREVLTCMPSQRSSAACYKCVQEDNVFSYSYFFSNLEESFCSLTSYRIQFSKNLESEAKVLSFLTHLGVQVENNKIYTPMVFEKDNYQIYIELIGQDYSLRFENDKIVKKIDLLTKNQNFLTDTLNYLWPKYKQITKAYLGEIQIKPEIIAKFESEIEKSVNDYDSDTFIKKIKDLDVATSNLNKESKACFIYNHDALLAHPVSDDLNKKLASNVRYHWSEKYDKNLINTVCGNFYYFERVKNFLFQQVNCDPLRLEQIKNIMQVLKKVNKNKIEKEIFQIYDFVFKAKNNNKNIEKHLASLSMEVDGLDSYKTFRRENVSDKNLGVCIK